MINKEILEPYFLRGKKHQCYNDACKFYNDLRIHANGEYPGEAIDERRPSESEEIKKYRKKIYAAITKGEGLGLVINALSKIRRSADWMVKFENEVPPKINEEETPEKYFNEKFPYYTSVTNYTFSVLLKEYLIDANGLILVLPFDAVQPNEYLRPVPMIFNSDRVIEHNEEFAVLKSDEKAYYDEGAKSWKGDVYYVVDKEDIIKYAQNRVKEFVEVFSVKNTLGYLPLVEMFGVYFDTLGGKNIYESRIQAMVPRLVEFVREYSDMQAEVVQHIHSEKYSFVQQQCGSCEGTGKTKGKGGKNVACPNCKGSGSILTSPYNSTYAVRPAKPSMEQSIPTPPIGYIQKNTEIAKLQSERLEAHMYKAFSAIAMQHLFQVPLNVSGVKKELDIDESITTVHNIAEDLVRIVDSIIKISVDWRYGEIIPNQEERKELLPFIPVPVKYDIISTDYLMEEVRNAKSSNLNSAIVSAMEKEIAAKKFYTDPKKKEEVTEILDLDPLAGYSMEQKAMLNADGIVSDLDYAISTYIQQFVQRAIREQSDETPFTSLSYDEKRVILEKYANDILKERKKKMLENAENGQPAEDSAANS